MTYTFQNGNSGDEFTISAPNQDEAWAALEFHVETEREHLLKLGWTLIAVAA